MVFFNYALRKLNAKIVYYGPGLCGKTTNLMWIHDNFEGGDRGKMISLATEGDRTIFFDLLPLEIGAIRGMDVTLQLYTVPGQVHYNSTRQLVLRGADGVVFVADSQRAMQGSNTDSFKNLQENLLLQGISLDGFPHILQFNKRDLRDVVSIEELNDDLNHYSVPIFEATATDGVGVQETLEGIVKLVMRNLRQRYEGATTGARTPGLEDSQVGIPDALSTPAASPTEVPPPEPISVREPPPPVEPVTVPEPAPVYDPEPPTVEPMTPPDPPPVEPVVPPDPLPVEQVVPPDSPPVEPIELPDTLAPEEPAPIESPAAVAFVDADPAETVDFSKAMESDPFGGMGGGFEDEVSTAVYDVNDDSAIDFEELKRLDAKKAPPMPPPTPEASPSAEPPSANSSELNFESLESEFLPPEAPAESPAEFDLESTDAGLKTQHATVLESHDSMAAFDFEATPPDMDSVPEFELEEPQPEAEPEPEPVYQEAEVVDDLIPEVAEFEPPPIPEPPVEAEAPSFVEEVSPVTAEATPDTIPPPAPAEGMYVDRIEAPSPFAPNPDSPGGSAEALEALSKIAKLEPVIGPEETEISPAAVVEEIDEVAEIVEPIETVELVEPFETVEPPPGAFSDDEVEEALPIIDPVAEIEAPPFADHEDALDAQPIVDINAGFEATPVAEVESELEALPVVDVEAELEAPPIGDVDAEFEPQPVADFEDQIAAMPAAEVEKELEALPTFDVEAELEALPAVKIPDEFGAPPAAEIDAEFEAPPGVDAETEDSPIGDVGAEPEPLPDTDLDVEREATPVVDVETDFEVPHVAEIEDELEAPPVVEIDAEFTAPSVADVEDDFEAPPIVEVEEELETAQAEAGDEGSDIPPEAAVDDEDEFAAEAIDDRLFEVTPVVPVVVGSADPWTEEELSGVYNLGEVEKAEQAAAIEAAAPPRDVEVRAEDNQLHLRLQGTGAIVESGQVRALDIEVPVPGAWVGNRRVTLQLRLTLTPDTEYEDDGSDNPS